MARSGVIGPSSSLMTGFAFGVPPIIRFGNQHFRDRVLPDLLLGRKRTCLAITEPGAGSDVASIETTAEKSEDGRYYIVSGTKKWCVGLHYA
jgi:acyl-CoA dehydrogenase